MSKSKKAAPTAPETSPPIVTSGLYGDYEKTPRLVQESAWPFPKDSTGACEPVDTITTETTREITA